MLVEKLLVAFFLWFFHAQTLRNTHTHSHQMWSMAIFCHRIFSIICFFSTLLLVMGLASQITESTPLSWTTTQPKAYRRSLAKRVIGGEDASCIDASRYVVQLVDRRNQTICSGSIIAPDVVLTAAHCVNDTFMVVHSSSNTLRFWRNNHLISQTESIKSNSSYKLMASEQNITLHKQQQQQQQQQQLRLLSKRKLIQRFRKVKIAHSYLNPQYPLIGVHRDDIAILKLSRKIVSTRRRTSSINAQTIDLETNRFEPDQCATDVRFLGFGQTYENDSDNNEYWKKRLRMLDTSVVNNCDYFAGRDTDDDDFIVTTKPNMTTFYGDSGGPLISKNGKQIGIATGLGYRSGSAKQFNNYFVRISNHADFINGHLGNK